MLIYRVGSFPLHAFLIFLLDSHFGHDKSKAILPYAALPSNPTLFFMGDGVSGS